MCSDWTNEAAIRRWDSVPRQAMEDTAEHGDFAKRHLLNPVVLRMLDDVSGKRVMDAGCGNGYFSRMLAVRGARVLGVEPGQGLFDFARERETELGQGIDYLQADLGDLPDVGPKFDAVVCNMVLMSIPDWDGALRACVRALKPGGLFVFSLVHPAFEQLATVWREHGEYRLDRYLDDYEILGPHGPDFHRPLSVYLNVLADTGCRLRETAEPRLEPELAVEAGLEGYERLPNFLVIAAEAPHD